MSQLTGLPYTRFIKQVITESIAILATEAAAQKAYELLQSAAWTETADQFSNIPPRGATLTGADDTWDAYKTVRDYASGAQKAYAGAVAYRIEMPQDAIDLATDITSIAVPVLVDRWLVDGIHLAAVASDSETPANDWTTIRTGDVALSAQLTQTTPAAEQTATLTLTMPASTAVTKYIYVYLTLEDYETFRGFWIEGAALVFGDSLAVTFDQPVQQLQAPVVPSHYVDPYLYLPFARDYSDVSVSNIALTSAPDGPPRAPDLAEYSLRCDNVKESHLTAESGLFLADHHAALSIAFWIKGNVSAGSASVFSINSTADHNIGEGLISDIYRDGATYYLRCQLWGIHSSTGLMAAPTFVNNPFDGDWHRVVFVYTKLAATAAGNASQAKVYLDGSLVNTVTTVNGFVTGATPTPLQHMAVGVVPNAAYTAINNVYYLDDIVIDRAAWDATKVVADYDAWRSLKPAAAIVTSPSAGSITDTTATITGTMDALNKGTVAVFYGTTDGGEVPANWDASEDGGFVVPEAGDSVSVELTGLTPSTTYFYAIRTVNDYGTFWTATQSFDTII